MQVTTAQLPEPPSGADRIFTTDHAVLMLDGASSFARQDIPASTYADTLGAQMARSLTDAPNADLVDVLAEAIKTTAAALDLAPGAGAPSSTVAICRAGTGERVDLLVLGDTQVALPDRILRDDRLGRVGAHLRAAYRARLSAGHGYDDEHRRLLAALQTEQLRYRNRPDGYWIAEADPQAARHALNFRAPLTDVPWAVLATDGAYKPMELHGSDDWPHVAGLGDSALRILLDRCHQWETTDPGGSVLPRAKRHDDKALAAVRFQPP